MILDRLLLGSSHINLCAEQMEIDEPSQTNVENKHNFRNVNRSEKETWIGE